MGTALALECPLVVGLGTTQVGDIVQNIVPKIEGKKSRKNFFA